MARILLIAGHNGAGTGAHGIIDEGAETIVLRDLVELSLINLDVEVITDKERDSLSAVIADMKAKARPDDILVDIHFNAANKKASGTETYHARKATDYEKRLAAELNKTVCACLGTRSRGIKAESSSQHSSLGILHCGCPSVLLEVCFCDNADDVRRYRERRNILGRNIANFLAEFCKTPMV